MLCQNRRPLYTSSSDTKLGRAPDMEEASFTILCTAATSSARSFLKASCVRLYAFSFLIPGVGKSGVHESCWLSFHHFSQSPSKETGRHTERVRRDRTRGRLRYILMYISSAADTSFWSTAAATSLPVYTLDKTPTRHDDDAFIDSRRRPAQNSKNKTIHDIAHELSSARCINKVCPDNQPVPPFLSLLKTRRTVLHQGVLALGEHVADGRGSWLEALGAQPLGVFHHVGVPVDELVGQGVPRQLERLDAVRRAPLEGRHLSRQGARGLAPKVGGGAG